MLDLLRKKARSWMTYAIFGVIIVSFALFFGYNDLQQGGGRAVVATVNGTPISQGEYDFAFDNNEAYYRQIFKDQMPDRFLEGLRQSTLQQLISRTLLVAVAAQQGFVITDAELATHIQSLPFLKNTEAQFDPLAYREQFLPAIAQQYQLNFETWARASLLAERVRAAVAATVQIGDDEWQEAIRREKTRYTFEVVRVDAEQLIRQKKLGDADAAKEAAVTLQAVLDDPAARKPLLATYGLTVDTVGPLPVQGHLPFLGPDPAAETVRALFALTAGARCPSGPFPVEQTWVACRLLTRESPAAAAGEAAAPDARERLEERYQQVVMEQWMQALAADATITRSL